jgi:hypothetical protein
VHSLSARATYAATSELAIRVFQGVRSNASR